MGGHVRRTLIDRPLLLDARLRGHDNRVLQAAAAVAATSAAANTKSETIQARVEVAGERIGPRRPSWSALVCDRNQLCVQGAAFLSHRKSDFEFKLFALNAHTKAAAWLRQATVRPRVAIGRAQRGCISTATLAEKGKRNLNSTVALVSNLLAHCSRDDVRSCAIGGVSCSGDCAGSSSRQRCCCRPPPLRRFRSTKSSTCKVQAQALGRYLWCKAAIKQ